MLIKVIPKKIQKSALIYGGRSPTTLEKLFFKNFSIYLRSSQLPITNYQLPIPNSHDIPSYLRRQLQSLRHPSTNFRKSR